MQRQSRARFICLGHWPCCTSWTSGGGVLEKAQLKLVTGSSCAYVTLNKNPRHTVSRELCHRPRLHACGHAWVLEHQGIAGTQSVQVQVSFLLDTHPPSFSVTYVDMRFAIYFEKERESGAHITQNFYPLVHSPWLRLAGSSFSWGRKFNPGFSCGW